MLYPLGIGGLYPLGLAPNSIALLILRWLPCVSLSAMTATVVITSNDPAVSLESLLPMLEMDSLAASVAMLSLAAGVSVEAIGARVEIEVSEC